MRGLVSQDTNGTSVINRYSGATKRAVFFIMHLYFAVGEPPTELSSARMFTEQNLFLSIGVPLYSFDRSVVFVVFFSCR